MTLRSNTDYGYTLSNIGGYSDASGNEYALVGSQTGLEIVDVNDPDNPNTLFHIPGPNSDWREVKTYRQYAYVTTEGGGGMTIVDLSQLPASAPYSQYTGDGAINGQIDNIHALHIDTATAFCYLYGSNLFNGAALFIDISDPLNPQYAGNFENQNFPYVHDGYAENDTLYLCHIYDGFVEIVDATDKNNPISLATVVTPTQFTHNSWINADHTIMYTTDENSGSYIGIYDISDLSNIQELSRFQTDPGSGSIGHNTHYLNDYLITSWYTQGVVVTDVARPQNPIEVGHYDTYAPSNGGGFNGDWGVYPFLPSGNLLLSDITEGFSIVTPDYVRGCYLEGNITDSITGNPINGALVQILSTTTTKNCDAFGDYKTGLATAGTYDIRVSKAGYYPKVIQGVSLSNGVLTVLDAELSPFATFQFAGTVVDSASNQPIANANVLVEGVDFTSNVQSDGSGNFSVTLYDGDYSFSAGLWGYHTVCTNISSLNDTTASLTLALPRGYYDDFAFDFGWTVNGTSNNAWERAIPIGTNLSASLYANPNVDVNSDCNGYAYVTDNGTVGGGAFDNDVDGGYTILTSPVFDATIYDVPVVEYYRWFACYSSQGGNGNDTLKIFLSNGITTVAIDSIYAGQPFQSVWRSRAFTISNFLPVTSTMQMIVRIEDYQQGNGVEGGLDKFVVTGNILTAAPAVEAENVMRIYPNPAHSEINLRFSRSTEMTDLKIFDATGKMVMTQKINGEMSHLDISFLKSGIYLVEAAAANGEKIHERFSVIR